LAGDHWSIAQVLSQTGDWSGALEEYRQAASLHEVTQGADPKLNASIRTHLAGDYYGMAEVLKSQGQKGPALEAARKSAAILQAQLTADPLNTTLRQYLAGSYEQAGELLESQGLLNESLENYRQALKIYQAAMAADRSDALSHRVGGYTETHMAQVLIEKKQPLAALKLLHRALDTFQALAKAAPNSLYVLHNYGNVYQAIGNAHAALAAGSRLSAGQRREHRREACRWYQKSLDIRRDLERRGQLTVEDTEDLNQVAKQASGCRYPSD
jgi:tetratricopeptide (TPR) repeat protein